MRTILLALCLMSGLLYAAQAQEQPKNNGQSRLALNLSNVGQDITLSYAGENPLGISFLSYGLAAEVHQQAVYNVFSFQITHRTGLQLSQNSMLNITLPFMFDAHPGADLRHYSFSPRLAFVSSFRGGSSLTSFIEIAIDRGNIREQHHLTRRIGGSYSLPISETLLEITSSVAELGFRGGEIHDSFSAEMSLSHRLSEDVSIAASASAARDFAKILTGGEIYRGVTDQRTLSLSLIRSFRNFEISPYLSFSDVSSNLIKTRDVTAGFRTTWAF